MGHSVLEILKLIEECYGAPFQIETDKACGDQLVDWVVLDTARALREYGWTATIDLRSGIAGMLSGIAAELQVGAATA